jgi:hypothetical protein
MESGQDPRKGDNPHPGQNPTEKAPGGVGTGTKTDPAKHGGQQSPDAGSSGSDKK